jgi:uncharacterized protein YegP (UPF0339 family)
MKNPKFQIFKGKDGQYYFHLRAANGEIICNGEGYTSLQNCRNGISAIKKVAVQAPVQLAEQED